MRKITADYIYDGKNAEALRDKFILIDDQDKIEAIEDLPDNDRSQIEHYKGAICPGFINSHCHLELSHLKDQIPTGTGLIPFISDVVTKRDFPPNVIQEKIEEADRSMWEQGIQAVGDISNTTDTFKVKAESPIYYHSFIELFDLLQAQNAEASLEQGLNIIETAENLRINASITPHAPYSVSRELLKGIVGNNNSFRLSIHNQETIPEDQFFLNKTGDFVAFYENFNLPLDNFIATGKTSLKSILHSLNPSTPTLFIHNSFTGEEDIIQAENYLDKLYWCTCPNANLYIENTLPSYGHFMNQDSKMIIGTDSLSSNWQLSILEEIKTLRKYQSALDTGLLLTWACYNGSMALGVEDTLGSFEKGKSPGVLHLSTDEKGQVTASSKVTRLV